MTDYRRGNVGASGSLGHSASEIVASRRQLPSEHIEDEARKLLALMPPVNAPLPGDEADDVVEEFYPEQTAAGTTADPEPPRSVAVAREEPAPALPSYIVVDADGEEHEYDTAEATTAALLVIFRDAKRRGGGAIHAAIENNDAAIRRLKDEGPADLGEALDDYTNPFGLAPLPQRTEQQPAQNAPARPGPADHGTATGPGPDNDAPNLMVPEPRIRAPKADWEYWGRQLEFLIDEGHPLAEIEQANKNGLEGLRMMLPAEHKRIVARLRVGERAQAAE